MQRATVEIFVDEAKTHALSDLRGGGGFRRSGCGPHDDAGARGRTTEIGCTAATSARKNRRRIVAAFARTPPIRQAHLVTAALVGRPHRQVPGRLLAAWAVHSAELGARRILVESCAQDRQDLAARTGALAHIGAPTTVRARVDRPHTRELRGGRGPDRVCLHRGRAAAARDRLAGHRGSGAVDKRKGRATTHNVRAPGLTFLTLRQDTLDDSGPLPHRRGTTPSTATTRSGPSP